MKTTPLFTGLLVTTMVAGLIFSACKKHDDASSTAGREEFATVSSQSDATAELVFDDVFNNIMGVSSEVAIGGTGVFGRADVSAGSSNRLEGVDSTTCYSVVAKQLNTTTRF